MSENEKMTETEKFLKEIEIIEDTLKENFAELKCSLQKIFACECGGPVLTEKEHSYLSSIIKPFRDRVTYIGMFPEGDYKSFIEKDSDCEADMKLQNCPRCGNSVRVQVSYNKRIGGRYPMIIRCSCCGLSTAECSSEKEAVSEWNSIFCIGQIAGRQSKLF